MSTKDASGHWSKGTSGNPDGRPPGSRNKSTLLLENLLADESEALVRKAIQLALKGDITALRLCLDRIYPPRKERTVELELPEITDVNQATAATRAILAAVAAGKITPAEAELLTQMVQCHVKVLETEDLTRRVTELEKALLGVGLEEGVQT